MDKISGLNIKPDDRKEVLFLLITAHTLGASYVSGTFLCASRVGLVHFLTLVTIASCEGTSSPSFSYLGRSNLAGFP